VSNADKTTAVDMVKHKNEYSPETQFLAAVQNESFQANNSFIGALQCSICAFRNIFSCSKSQETFRARGRVDPKFGLGD
jgi:hypothetical protein